MAWAHRVMIVPDANVAVARSLAKTIAPAPSADGLWLTGVNALGTGVATHWISNGFIQDNFAALLGNSANTYAAYQAAGGTTITLAQIQALYAAATIRQWERVQDKDTLLWSDQVGTPANPFSVLKELGLKLIGGTVS
jgi:hypothetical protein